MSRLTVIGIALFALAFSFTTSASAEPRTKVPDICTGCLASVARGSDSKSTPAPLLVTLHGDWGAMAPEVHAAWERYAAPRGVALLSLTCPVALGCKKSWWQWNGDPSWITQQVDKLAAQVAIDRERVWLAGWSGGAAYMGMNTQELERKFAALVFHGGGVWPTRQSCAPEKAPVFFLAGDQNPLHPHVLVLKKHYEDCGNEVSFTLLRGAEHTAEWKALDTHGKELIEQLAAKRLHVVAAASASTGAPASASPTSSLVPSADAGAPLPSSSSSSSSPQPPEPVRPRAGCGCDLTRTVAGAPWAIAAVALALLARRRRA